MILSFNGKDILDSASLPPMVGRVPVGQKAKLKVLREGHYKTIEVVIESLKNEINPAVLSHREVPPINRLGVQVTDLEESHRAGLRQGAYIEAIQSHSVADRAGLNVGDIILKLNHKKINNKVDFDQLVKTLPVDHMIPVLIYRNGANQFLVLKIESK